jgi:hypothetical protein
MRGPRDRTDVNPDRASRLEPLPPRFAATVAALHRVAERIVAPARKPDNEIALEPTPGGFGTPVFDHARARRQVRVEGADLVERTDAHQRRTPLTTLRAAGCLVADLLPPAPLDDGPLDTDPAAARVLAAWYAFGATVLGDLATSAAADDDPSPARLWPEHFDLAIDLGAEAAGRRATYGFSPGDDDHAEPYAYVAPWTAEVTGDLWRARGFRGADLPYAALVAAADPRAAALDFFTDRRDALA